jgi:membrane associated rhomboid family serine protease
VIPLRDDVPSRTYPFVNITLIVANVVVWFYELSLGPQLESFLNEFGAVPAHYFRPDFNLVDRIVPLFASIFIHGGWFHVIGNMLFLYIFGDNVEDRVGHLRYIVFYLLCGLVASMTHIIVNATSTVPTVGASGAIAGVLGAYMLLYPKAKVVALLPLFIFFHVLEVPAIVFLGLWFLYQFLYASLALSNEAGGVAWWAHIGGFLAGTVLIWGFRKRRRLAGRDTRWAR